jgi:hypothetical protein
LILIGAFVGDAAVIIRRACRSRQRIAFEQLARD